MRATINIVAGLLTISSLAGCVTTPTLNTPAHKCDNLSTVHYYQDSSTKKPTTLVDNIENIATVDMSSYRDNTYSASDTDPNFTEALNHCTQALNSLTAEENWLRRATLLRARAIFYILEGNYTKALQDVDDAHQLITASPYHLGFDHGLTLSLDVLHVIASNNHYEHHNQKHERDQLLLNISKAYPYSNTTQEFSFTYLSADFLFSEEADEWLKQVIALSPSIALAITYLYEWRAMDAKELYSLYASLVKRVEESHQSNLSTTTQTHLFARAAIVASRAELFEESDILFERAQENIKILPPESKKDMENQMQKYNALKQGFYITHTKNKKQMVRFLQQSQQWLALGSTFDLFDLIYTKYKIDIRSTRQRKTIWENTKPQVTSMNLKSIIIALELAPGYIAKQSKSNFAKSADVQSILQNNYTIDEITPDEFTIKLRSRKHSLAITQELLLLRAAMSIKEQGGEYFIVLKRGNISHANIRHIYSGHNTSDLTQVGFTSSITIKTKKDDNQLFTFNANEVIKSLRTRYP